MTTYTVASGRLLGQRRGSHVEADALKGCDIAALVAAGHLVPDEPAQSSKANPATSKKEK